MIGRFLTVAVLLTALASAGTATVASANEAEAKVCKSGKVLNPETGKCVTPRGS